MLAGDFLVHYSELLEECCDRVSGRWVRQSPEDVERLHADLLRSIGRGPCDFIIRSVGGCSGNPGCPPGGIARTYFLADFLHDPYP